MPALAQSCDLAFQSAPQTTMIDYDVFSFSRANGAMTVEIENRSDSECRAEIMIQSESGQTPPLRFIGAGIDMNLQMASGGSMPAGLLSGEPYPIRLAPNSMTRMTIDVFSEQHVSVPAGRYDMNVELDIMSPDSGTILQQTNKIVLSVPARAQINVAGTSGRFDKATYMDRVYFDEPEMGDLHNMFVQTRANSLTSMTITSQQGGKMTNPNMPDSFVRYELILDGKLVDLTTPWTISGGAATSMDGVSIPATIRIIEDGKIFAGEYRDVLTFDIVPQ